ncbi:MAG: hypothetical protein ISS66_08190 [Desulfobacteraceae bacterium]|nr:hypothetical protein [Desulfobacteraceae bacterium]
MGVKEKETPPSVFCLPRHSLSDGGSSVLYLLLCAIITGLCLDSGEG